MARVVLERLTKVFGGPRGRHIQAVRDLSFAVEDKELLVLAGPSGCGKTTTLRLIAGLEEPSAGTISIDGKVVNDVPARDRDVAMVFQNLALYPHMTARENLTFGLKARKHSKPEISRRIEEAAAMLDLADCLDRKPSELSGGQRQRVALGRAIVLRPKILLLDEPLSNLDAPLRARMRIELSRLHAIVGTTMVYVTHEQTDAMILGQRIAVLKDGELQHIGDPMTLYRRPANLFVAGFFGVPAMNFFRGIIIRKEQAVVFVEEGGRTGEIPTSNIQHPEKLQAPSSKIPETNEMPPFELQITEKMGSRLGSFSGKPLIMGIRPENMFIANAGDNGIVRAKLERIELLGGESHLHFSTGAHSLTVRSAGVERAPVSRDVQL